MNRCAALIFISFTSLFQAGAKEKISEVQFQAFNRSVTVRMERAALHFTNSRGTRSLTIEPCNRKLANQYWDALLDRVKSVKRVPAGLEHSKWIAARVRFEGLQFPVLSFDRNLSAFFKLDEQTTELFFESMRVCKKKL